MSDSLLTACYGPGERVLRDRWGEPLPRSAEEAEAMRRLIKRWTPLPFAPGGHERNRLIDSIEQLYAARGRDHYGEGVSQSEHALQAATLAEREGAGSDLVVAALLHDIGHLLDKRGEKAAERGIDTRHEAIAGGWLTRYFGPAVAEPVRLHVAAKRYLCAVESGYHARLSPASVRSLALQGGPMDEREAAAFRAGRYAESALRLRRWDERAKRPGAETPAFDHFRRYLQAVARQAQAA